MIKKYWQVIIPILLIVGYLGYQFTLTTGIAQISTEELATLLDEKQDEEIFFVDVREVNEFNDGHIQGMVNVPLSQLEQTHHQIPTNQQVVIFCRSGNRSLQAANLLKDLGYTNLTNVKGGILAWEGHVIK
ncbi:rhodanese-like domain-containing protein [Bacillus sp. FJAT-45350]|uniref:rhodanese-like domain-containing protein n=1 Tax=Bacillus sp. FJAT-45350 TaxID=2011014 RepID=UPI00211BFC80|nr:rhodanese-like domain-containing protein [Bacillus sp. FJAT-45350]